MKYITFFLFILPLYGLAQPTAPPDWFLQTQQAETGVWVASNTEYQSETEPAEAYSLEWEAGIHPAISIGKMYALEGEKKMGPLWQFLKYWDPLQGKATLIQFATDGTCGIGEIRPSGPGKTESIQTFTAADGSTFKLGHRMKSRDSISYWGNSFRINDEGKWIKNRTYLWKKQNAGVSKTNRIHTYIDSSAGPEWVMIQELKVEAPVEAVWKAYTTAEGWKGWAAPQAEVELKVGGYIKTRYDTIGAIGQAGTITTHIINYVPQRLLTLQAEVTENFPAFMKEDEKDFYNIIQFAAVGDRHTRITSYGLGYKNTPKYRALMSFFIQGNEMSLRNLIKHLEG